MRPVHESSILVSNTAAPKLWNNLLNKIRKVEFIEGYQCLLPSVRNSFSESLSLFVVFLFLPLICCLNLEVENCNKTKPGSSCFQEEVMTMERILLQTVKFDLQVEHPYSFLLSFAKQIKGRD